MIHKSLYFTLPYLIVYAIVANLLYFVIPIPPIFLRSAWMGLALYGVCKYYKYRLNAFEKALIIFTIYNLLIFFTTNPISFTEIGATLLIALTFPTFGLLGRQGLLDRKFFIIAGIILLICAIPAYRHEEQLRIMRILANDGNVSYNTVNASTIFLMIFPMVFVVKKKLLSLAIFAISLFFIVSSAKRGNIVAVIIPTVLYLWYFYRTGGKSFFKKVLVLCLFVIAASYAWEYIQTDDYLIKRYEDTLEGNSSGRDTIYSSLWNLWYNKSSDFQYFLGFGYYGTRLYGPDGRFAHQDWLEILVDYGLLGFLIYAVALLLLLRIFFKVKTFESKSIILSIFCIWICKASVSMGFTDQRLATLAIPYGYVMWKNSKYLKKPSPRQIISNEGCICN